MSTDSSLTDISEGGDVEMEPPRPSAQKAYEQLLVVLDTLEATFSEIPAPPELRDDWSRSIAAVKADAVQRPSKIAFLGRTGAGKSTLLNALLKQQVLSASAAGACTAVITEISYGDGPTFQAVVEFISREQWAKDLAQLIEDANDTTVDNEEESADETNLSPASQARKTMCEIFPDLRDVSENSWKVEELLDDPVVQSYLGHTKIFVAKDNVNFQKELEQFLSSTLGGSDTRAFWPLVKIVKITGPFDVLVNGSIFVDLPGYGDLNPVRNRMAADYLQHAQGVCLVAPISRAKDDTGVYAQLKKNLSQTIIDGRIRDKSIIIALTGNDNAIGDNEITLKPANQATVEQLKKEALEYNQEWNALRVKMQKKEKSKAKRAAAAITQLKEQMNEILRKKTLKTKEMDRIMAVERSELVSASLQDTYFQLYRDLSPATTDIPTIPIFCVGSQDYMRIQQIDVHASSIFDVAEETGIPKLQSYFESQGEHRNLSDAIRVVSHACEFFPRISSIQFSSSPMGNQATVQTMIDNSHERCKLRLDELIIGIEKVYHDLLVAVKAAACDAEGKSASIFERHNTKKWNQYRTMMRQEGLYQNYNLNADLTKDILTRCRRHWMQAVNNQIPIHIKDFRDAIRKDLADTVKPIVKHSLRKGLARTIELFADDIQSQSIAKTQEAQRLGNRFERVITGLLKSHYARVSAEKGNGMYKRMKMNREYIQDHARDLFNAINLDTEKVFAGPVKSISDENKEKLKAFCKYLGQTINGVEISSKFDPSGQARKALKAFVDTHENPTMTLLDDLQTRLEQILPS